MLVEDLCVKRLRNVASNNISAGYQLLQKGGYIHQTSGGLFTLSHLGYKIFQKICKIIREEMDQIGFQEFSMPVVTPAHLWQETNRLGSVDVLAGFQGRNNQKYVIACTHEEVCVDFVRNQVDSYKQLPIKIYQIQTKFRDELRARAGLIRVREFTMKDAYSFHATKDDLNSVYEEVRQAYHRIYERLGFNQILDIKSDTGDMHGSKSHEFVAISNIGEDTIIICEQCGYRANQEVATANMHCPKNQNSSIYHIIADKKMIVKVIIDENRQINYTKLKKHLSCQNIYQVNDSDINQVDKIIIDNLCADNFYAANINEQETNEFERADVVDVQQGDLCSQCGEGLQIKHGIELGNIFQQDNFYTKSMNFTYLDDNGKQQHPYQGAYGIGVTRIIGALAEEFCYDKGIAWPISVAPFMVHICAFGATDETISEQAKNLYSNLKKSNIEVILDARPDIRIGAQLCDADLIGAPIRLIVSKRNLQNNQIEISYSSYLKDTHDLPQLVEVGDVETIIHSCKHLLGLASHSL